MIRRTQFNMRLNNRLRASIEELVRLGKYESMTAFVEDAIIHHLRYLEERDFRRFIISNEGKARIREIVKEELQDINEKT